MLAGACLPDASLVRGRLLPVHPTQPGMARAPSPRSGRNAAGGAHAPFPPAHPSRAAAKRAESAPGA